MILTLSPQGPMGGAKYKKKSPSYHKHMCLWPLGQRSIPYGGANMALYLIKSSYLLPYIFEKVKMHDYYVHEAFNPNCEIHSPWMTCFGPSARPTWPYSQHACMRSQKTFSHIVVRKTMKFIAPGSRVHALGRTQFDQIVNMNKIFKILLL